jgi:dienelactone hydrolase
MKNRLYHLNRTLILFLLAFLTSNFVRSQGMVQKAVVRQVNSVIGGYYEALPQEYNNTTKKYPLLVFIHGMGEVGNGSSQLSLVLRNGPPKLINQNHFPGSFSVNGQSLSFIVISPQLNTATGAVPAVNDLINQVVQQYRVDENRIYITGLSMGGGISFEYAGTSAYADRLAAVAIVCGNKPAYTGLVNAVGAAQTPVWAFHNLNDGTCPVSYTNDWISKLNAYVPKVVPAAKKTIFPVSGHDAWTKAYDPTYKEDGKNVYEWMLQYTRNGATAPPASNTPPAVNAGADIGITLPANSSTLTATASDNGGSIVSYKWDIVSQPAGGAAVIASKTAAATAVNNLVVAGNYQFKITVTDNQGSTASDTKNITVNPASGNGTTTRSIKVNFFAGSNPEASWNNWNVKSSLSSTTFNFDNGTSSGITAQLSNQTSVSDNSTGYNTTMAPVNVGRYASYSTTNRTLTLNGLDNAKQYALEIYSSRKGISHNSTRITVNGVSQTILTDNNLSTPFSFGSITPSSGKISVSIEKLSTYNYINGFILTEIGSGTGNPGTNAPPVVNAGTDKSIQLPLNSVALSATASDANGSIASYSWSKVSGPSSFSFSNTSIANPTLSGLAQGTYTFRLTVTDNQGATASDDVNVVVNAATSGGGETKYVKVSLFAGSNPYNNSEWNNWNTTASLSSAALKYSDGTTSTVKATLSQQSAVSDNGSGFNPTMCPAPVGRYASYSTSNRTLTISGLDDARQYTLELYAARTGVTKNTTRFTLDGNTVDILTDNNTTKKASFTATPVNGKLVINLQKLATYNYLNGFVLTETGSGQASAKSIEQTNTEESQPALQVFPNPVNDRAALTFKNPFTGKATITITDMSGVIKQSFTISKNQSGAIQTYISIPLLSKGQYILSVEMINWKQSLTITKL